MASAEAGHVCDQPAKVSVLDHFVHAVYLRMEPDPHYQGLPAFFSPWKFVLVDLKLTDGDLFGLAPSLPQGHPQLDPEPGLLLVKIMCSHNVRRKGHLGIFLQISQTSFPA